MPGLGSVHALVSLGNRREGGGEGYRVELRGNLDVGGFSGAGNGDVGRDGVYDLRMVNVDDGWSGGFGAG